ncbi:DnaJ domain-containing protein [Francisella noatunensis]|uniref:DnaJ domain-containing protein n=1 Tax=Francisella noatunensis TaxID=657445 RepID=A0A9Q2QHB1_9GAMM|nr:DnaJ C-terminal domain-containing protein [Francisella noatunensis]MBK2028647.1 DnaJ domain-containing protein [Francisella noatunensis]MBK2034299.1 DnaJ domain-containing protein [Francisella noatunensis]MBK2048546.1 DnaJ domain-containing protein [Francisella noatunensis]MBK2049831.1 DnaJ domain-containing protein [Francisella noatunensis]MBK2051342.1 DnaJ domain-containing protein [Francisella noatunensis]
MADYYSLLGVSKDASEAELKKTYRRLAKKYHPDVNKEKGAEDKFKEIQTAYDVLGDKEKRKLYDAYGENWDKVQQGGFGGAGGGFGGFSQGGGSQSFNFEDLGDIFGDLFGGGGAGARGFGGGQPRARKGEDINISLRLNVEDAIKGGSRTVSYSYQEAGANGMPTMQHKSVDVKIPPAMGNGKKLRVKGKGSAGIGANAPAGDLYIKVEVVDHKNYKVDGNDIYEHINIAPWEAALGTSLEIDTPYGKKKMKVPEGSQSGRKMRIKGKGLGDGDFYIVYDVKLPPADTDEKKEFYKQMQEKMNFDPRA